MRIAVIAALPFPYPQGSQVYVREQIRSLIRAGHRPLLFCYGTRTPGFAEDRIETFEILRSPSWLSPRRLRAGPALAKPFADLFLFFRLWREHRRCPFDLCLGHNLEGGVLGILLKKFAGVPTIYAAHTLLEYELPSYLPATPARNFLGRFTQSLCAGVGRAFDTQLAAGSNGVLVLSRAAATELGPVARGPLECIPPGFTIRPPPKREAIEAACQRHGLAPGAFALYAGNLDGYQAIDLLKAAAKLQGALPIVVATHHKPDATIPPVMVCTIRDPEEVRLLTYGCALALLPRRISGGFPIKLLNYMEASRAIVLFAQMAETLENGRSAWVLDEKAGATELARAIEALAGNPELATRLGAGARTALEIFHDPEELREPFVGLLEGVWCRRRRMRRSAN